MAALSERFVGFTASRPLPQWAPRPYRGTDCRNADVLLFADTFNRYFEPGTIDAAKSVLTQAGIAVADASAEGSGRPLCCGRTFLAVGLVDEARKEMRRTTAAFKKAIDSGGTIVGLEPSCVMTFRDEAPALLGDEWTAEHGKRVLMFEEYLFAQHNTGKAELTLGPIGKKALLHGHCHQKSFASLAPVQQLLELIPDLTVEIIATSCCGMAGAFGYQRETVKVSRAMGELSLLPRIRTAESDTVIVADGVSCGHQIADWAGRKAVHAAVVIQRSNHVGRSLKL